MNSVMCKVMSLRTIIFGQNFLHKRELLSAPHPNVFYGQYPIKKQKKTSWFDGVRHSFVKVLLKTFKSRSCAHASMLKRVHANHKILASMSDAQLDKWIVDIKRQLHRKGLKEELICRAFAIIKEVANREIEMSHYDSQLIGGWVMMHGEIAEMQTGEGKTLAATLPAGCAAMANMPVHVVTVNDYLVERDAEIMRPVYERLGLTVGCVVDGMSDEQRQQAYRCNITYCTSKQVVFDYLRDRLTLKIFSTELDLKISSLYKNNHSVQDKLLLRGLSFAVVDEIDSVFIDEARTPLILSSRSENSQQEELHREAIWLARQMDNEIYYLKDVRSKQITLTPQGEDYLTELTVSMQGLWCGERRSKTLVQQALSALHCYERDVNYFVEEGEIQIIDENTGRSMPDRSWEAGLHQMIEEKEGCEQTGQNQTIARISYQKFFSRYLKLSGMTGTSLEVAGELWDIYGLSTCQVATHKPQQRRYDKTFVYYTYEEKSKAIVDEAISQQAFGRPVLIGTRTLKDSEYISKLLNSKKITHQVLNAKQHRLEAEIVESAGVSGCITVATNMAGRGTDIKLDAASEAAGGLHVICCEKNDSRRIDRQLVGRCSRQGDPGSYTVICSLEDDAVLKYFSSFTQFLQRYRNKRQLPPGSVVRPYWLASALIYIPQRVIEYYHRQIRKSMMKIDENRESMLAFTGESE